MAAEPDRLSDISDKEIERLHNIILRGLERRLERLERLGGRSPKPVEPIDNVEPT
jgi:hypothetical protein